MAQVMRTQRGVGRRRRGPPDPSRGRRIIVRTLERSRHDVEFQTYASMLHFFAALVLVVEMVVHLLVHTGQWVFLLPLTRVCQLSLMGLDLRPLLRNLAR